LGQNIITQYRARDKIEKELDGPGMCARMEEGRVVHKVLVGETGGKETTGETKP
jgi:hypothetical protein